MDPIPTTIEEIDRKVATELERVMTLVTQARIPVTQAYGAVIALWNATSGIASGETLKLVQQASELLDSSMHRSDRPQGSIAMFGDGRVYLLERRGGLVTVRIMSDKGEATKQERCSDVEPLPERWALNRMNAIAGELALKGIRRLN